MKKIITLNEFQELIGDSNKHIIKVSASWCGPCRMLTSVINEMENSIKELIIEVDADEAEDDLINFLHVRNLPLILFYDHGEELLRKIIKTKEEFLDFINDTESSK